MAEVQVGCYEIFNTVNGKRYVGQAENMEKRFVRHRWELRRGVHHSLKLQHAWVKHGESVFRFLPILTCQKSMLDFYEQQLLDKVKPEYNICVVASSTRGIKHPPRSPDFGARSRAWRTGRPASPQARKNMSKSFSGRKYSAEAIRKSALARTGAKRSPEACLNISLGHLNPSPEARKNMSAAHKGKPWTALQRAAHKETPHSPERKAKMSVTMLAVWAAKKQIQEVV